MHTMAVPTVPRTLEQRPPEPQLLARMRRLGPSLSRALLAIILAFSLGGIVITLTNGNPLAAYWNMFLGAFGDLQSFSYTLVIVTSLIFAGLSVAIANRDR